MDPTNSIRGGVVGKKLLLISFHFPPSAASGSFRLLGFAQHLPALGWDMSVVTCSNYPWEPTDRQLLEKLPEQVHVNSVDYRTTKVLSKVVASRIGKRSGVLDNASVWCHDVRATLLDVARRMQPDIVLTSGPPHSVHMLGRLVKKKFNSRWVADFRDPWVAGRWNSVATKFWERWREKRLVADADLIVANAPNAQGAYRELYPTWRDKFVVVTNGYDPICERPARSNREMLRVLHLGEIYSGRNPSALFDAIARVNSNRDFKFEFIGRVQGIDLAAEVEQRRLSDRIEIRGHVSKADAGRAMANADALLLMDTPGRQIGVPAKLYEYIGSGRPVLAFAEPDSDTAWALRKSEAPHALRLPAT